MCPLSFETTSNALTNWFMAPLLANMGSDGTVSPSHFSLSGPIDPALNEPQFAPSQFPIFRVPVSTPSRPQQEATRRSSPAPRTLEIIPALSNHSPKARHLKSTGQLEFKSISTEPGYPIAFGLAILAASAVTSVYFNPAPVLKSTTRSSALR